MSNVFAIHAVGESLRTYLDHSYPAELRAVQPCEFRLVSSGELASTTAEIDNALTIYLYRVTVNEHLRNARKAVDARRDMLPLSVDLHYLVTVWTAGALAEHTILAWAMRQLQQHPILDQSSLAPEAGWAPDDFVQLVPGELSVEDMMRIWDALQPPYRLSVAYVARVVRIDTEPSLPAEPVVATRFLYEQTAGAGSPS